MSRQSERSGAAAVPNINVTPFIDILLVLLIIFMVITPLKPARFKAMIPEPPPDNEIIKKSPRTLVVSVGEDRGVKLLMGQEVIAEGSVANSGAVAARLAREFDARRSQGVQNPEFADRADLPADERVLRTVFIKAPRTINYGEVARVIDSVKGAGASPVGLQTDELEGDGG